MSSEWTTHRLADLATFKYGKFLSKSNLSNEGFPVFSGYGVVGYLPTYQFDIPQLIIVCRGEGGTGDIKMSPSKCSITNLSIIVSEKMEKVRRDFLYWTLKASDTHRLRTGSAQAQIVIGSLENFTVSITANKTLQENIAKTLTTLDDRIALLRETNATLEAIVQALFKSWFVDFDPVRAKQQGREPEGMDAATAALFPDSFEESELGLVPKDWSAVSLRDVSINYSETFDFSTTGEVVFVNTGDVSEGQFLHKNYVAKDGLPGQAKKAIHENDILFSEIRPKNKRFAYVNFDSRDYVVSTKFMVLRSTSNMHPRFLYQILRQDETIEYFNMIAESRSGTFPQITFDSISKFLLVRPSSECIEKYIECIEPLLNKIDLISTRQKSLVELRDTLLPRLISGQLRLPED